jgi:DNA-binding HxlR family transcriptional regulator
MYRTVGQVRTTTWGTNMRVSTGAVSARKTVDYGGPVAATLDVIGGRWKVVILSHLIHEGTHRFAVLRRKIPSISERMLTQQLRELEGDGIVQRKVYAEVPPKVEYSLTDYGKTLRPITAVMCEWGQKHIKRIRSKAK